jgi:mono/diheme cytochrome c family protein
MRKMLNTLILSIAALSTLALAAASPVKHAALEANGTDDSKLVSKGHTVFLSNCAPCHGAQAQGDDGPNLHKLGLPESVISSTVTHGIKDEMPSFAVKLKGDNLKAVVAYVHSLQ